MELTGLQSLGELPTLPGFTGRFLKADKLSIGNVEVQSLTDAEASMPFPLEMLFPNAPAEAWEEFTYPVERRARNPVLQGVAGEIAVDLP